MVIVDAGKIASDLSGYIEKVQLGETFVIAVDNQPVAELRPAGVRGAHRRPSGLCVGEFKLQEDFNAPLPDEIISGFESR